MVNSKVCIIILNWNGKELLKDCLSSLFKLTDYPNYKVIVVDNGSTDGSVEFVKKNFPKAEVLALDKNYGFSKGNNIGIKYALKKYKPKYILLLNNDTKIIQKDWLTKLVETAESDEKIGIVGCNLIFPDGSLQDEGVKTLRSIILPNYVERKPYKTYNKILEYVIATSGACFLIRSDIIERHQLFYDEMFSPASYEDVDLCIRVRKRGLKIAHRHDVKIIHKASITWKKQGNEFRFWLISRNYFFVLLKHFKKYIPFGIPIRLLTCIFYKKDENPPNPRNIRVRPGFLKKIFILIKAVTDAIRIYYQSV
jgi:GT2 family glycosyltransferase